MKYSNIFWGVILVSLGSLFFLKNLDILFFDWGNILKLWPLLLVLWGISILPTKPLIKVIVSFVLIVITIAFVANNNNYYTNGFIQYKYEKSCDVEEQHFYEPYHDSIEKAVLHFDAAAGKFEIWGEAEHLLEFYKEGNLGPYKFLSNSNNKKKELKISLKKGNNHKRNLNNKAELNLNPNTEWDIYLDAGAAKIELDLSNLKTKYLDIDGGASSVRMKLGKKSDYTKLNIDAGVSSLNIKIPRTSACEIRSESFLLSKNFSGFEKIKSGVYRTNNFDDNPKKIHINIDAAISSFKVRRY